MFKSRRTMLRKRAETLLPAAQIAGVSAYTSLVDKFPQFSSVSIRDWDFLFPVAAVFVATMSLDSPKISIELKSELSAIYGRVLDKWSKDWNRAFKDCGDFFWRTADALQQSNDPEYIESPKYGISDPLGTWLVWNLLGFTPQTPDERKLIRAVGLLATVDFIGWWN